MISQFKIMIATQNNREIPQHWAYRLYAWLLSQISEDTAGKIHQSDKRALSQYLDHNVWKLTIYDIKVAELFNTLIEHTNEIILNSNVLCVSSFERSTYDAETFLRKGNNFVSKKAEMRIISPAAFKQAGRYCIFPTEALLIHSLQSRWNEVFPDFLLEDSDTTNMLGQGVHIVDYNLRTGRYPLKETAIPCFYGKVFLEAKLPVILMELWNALLRFASYSGIGIKTTLGMGGTGVQFIQ